MPRRRLDPVDAAFVLPVAFAGRLHGGSVVVLTSVLIAAPALVAEPLAAGPLAAVGWFTVAGFSHAPYGDLQAAGGVHTGVVLAGVAAGAVGLGTLGRKIGGRGTLDAVTTERNPGWSLRIRPSAISRRRLLAGLAVATAALPALTAALAAARPHLALVDDLLFYLIVVIAVTIIGGFWPAVAAAVAAGLLLNWFFTPPEHTWTIEAPANILALLLFVTIAVTVSSIVHLSARRSALAAERANEAATLLALARTVLGGDDSPQAVIGHLTASLGLGAELRERSGSHWVSIA